MEGPACIALGTVGYCTLPRCFLKQCFMEQQISSVGTIPIATIAKLDLQVSQVKRHCNSQECTAGQQWKFSTLHSGDARKFLYYIESINAFRYALVFGSSSCSFNLSDMTCLILFIDSLVLDSRVAFGIRCPAFLHSSFSACNAFFSLYRSILHLYIMCFKSNRFGFFQ